MSEILLTNPAEILEEISALFADFNISGLPEAAEIYTDRNYIGSSILINDGITWRKFLENYSKEWDAFIFPEPSGSIGYKVLPWGTITAEISLLEDAIDYESFKVIDDRQNIITKFQRFYDYNPRTKKFKFNPEDIISNQEYAGRAETFECKYHTNSATNKDVVSRSIFLLKFPIRRYEFRVLPQNGNNIDVGMIIEAPLPGLNTGTRLMFVTSKKPSNEGDLLKTFDISTINEGLIILYPDGDPNIYLLSDENEKVLI